MGLGVALTYGEGLVFLSTCRGTRYTDVYHRSVHNTRIERLWYDVTHGFGQKWKNFFLELEAHHGLNPMVPAHIWLLHHLFLAAINEDAQEWAHVWNNHKMSIRGERQRSPRDMFFFSMVQDGVRGLPAEDEEDIGDPALYGIDWEDAQDPRLLRHHMENNPGEASVAGNSFQTGPAQLSEVPCEPPNCPFSPEQVAELDGLLADRVDVASRNMHVRRLVWLEALAICTEMDNA